MAIYERADIEAPNTPHKIFDEFGRYGELKETKEAGWIYKKLEELFEDGNFALGCFHRMVKTVSATNYGDYRPEVAKQLKAEKILEGRRSLMTFLEKHLSAAEKGMEAAEKRILEITQPEPPEFLKTNECTAQLFREREIRDLLRQTDPLERRSLVKGNLDFIKALVNSPAPIIKEEVLNEFRREYAFQLDPSLKQMVDDNKIIYNKVRKAAAQINATCVRMLLDNKLRDPLPELEHFRVFKPASEYEKTIADERSLASVRKTIETARKRKLSEVEEGERVDVRQRLAPKNIPH